MAFQLAAFNFAIMMGSWLGGRIVASGDFFRLNLMGLGLMAISLIIIGLSRRTFIKKSSDKL